MSVPRLYVLTGALAGCHNTCAIYQRDLLSSYPSEQLAVGVVGPLGGSLANRGCLPWLTQTTYPVWAPRERQYRCAGAARAARFIALRRRELACRSAIAPIVAHARAFGPDRLLVVLTNRLMYRVALDVARELRVTLSAIVMDPPAWLVHLGGADRWTMARWQSDFAAVMSASESAGVLSQAMADEYRTLYRTRPVVLIHGFDRAQWLPTKSRPLRSGEFMLAFAGSLYATDAWHALLAALDASKWTVGERTVRLMMLGAGPCPTPKGPAHFEVYGWLNQSDAIQVLADADAGYVPYWFDTSAGHAEVSRLSFPSKAAAYIAAGLPVLFHGPSYAWAGSFISESNAGVWCTDLNPPAIQRALDLLAEVGMQECFRPGIEHARETTVGAHVFRSRFAELVGASAEALLPPRDPVCTCPLSAADRVVNR